MVNKKEKTAGAKNATASTAPKARVASKPKPAPRSASVAPAVEAVTAAKPAKPVKKHSVDSPRIRQEDIAFRAYLIAEKRQQLGLPGDSLGDWVEAERQLLGERTTHGVN